MKVGIVPRTPAASGTAPRRGGRGSQRVEPARCDSSTGQTPAARQAPLGAPVATTRGMSASRSRRFAVGARGRARARLPLRFGGPGDEQRASQTPGLLERGAGAV
jgi:hypothetical protein